EQLKGQIDSLIQSGTQDAINCKSLFQKAEKMSYQGRIEYADAGHDLFRDMGANTSERLLYYDSLAGKMVSFHNTVSPEQMFTTVADLGSFVSQEGAHGGIH